MSIDTKDIITYTRKTVVFLISTIYRSSCEHPFVLGMVFFLLLLYRFFPNLFGFLLSFSPIIICTALLLGMLLSFGQPNIPEIEKEEKAHGPSPPRMHAIANDLIMEEDESFSSEEHVENREKVEEASTKEAKFIEQVDHVSKSKGGALLSASNQEEERKPEADAGLILEVHEKQIHIENIATSKEEVNNRGHFGKAEIHEAKLLEDATEFAEHTYPATGGQNETEVLKVEARELAMEGQFDSSLVSSWNLVDNRDASESDSDHAESSSPDASMADIIPMLDELHPLLDSEDPLPVNVPMDDLHSISGASTEDGESDDGSGEEEAENQGEGGEEEEEEAKEENEDGAALAVKWTEDDAKNLMVLGSSELERNQRLENLIAKRRARKNRSLETEINLIDLDANETMPMMDELSRIQMQIPPISTARRNPFDLPYDSEVPIPGSAPSVLLPTRNPFDLPHEQAGESNNLPGVSHQGFAAVPQREMFFRRHESFAIGASFTGEFKQDKHDIKMRPYFVTERTDLEDASYAPFERQLSEKSDSKVSSVLESESNSSVADEDSNDEIAEQPLHPENEIELVSSSTNDAKHVEREDSSSDEMDSVDPLCGNKEINICSSHDVESGASEAFGVSIHEAVDDLIKVEEQNRHDLDLCSPISDAAKSDAAEGKYSRSSSSCSSELSMKNLSTKSEEGSIDLQQPSGDSSKGSIGSMQSVSGEIDIVNDCHVVEPVYDSSPSAIEKSLSNIASLEEELLHEDKGSFKSTSSLSSETYVETSGIDSPPVLAERSIFTEIINSMSGTESMAEMSASDNGGLWVAPLNLSSVEENESRSREVEEIREQDVIQVEFTEVNDEYDHPAALTLPESAMEQVICYSSSSSTSTETDSIEDMGEDLQFSEQGNVVETPHSDALGSSDYSSSQVPANAQPPIKSSTDQASFGTFLAEQQVEILPSIPKYVSDHFKHEGEYENASSSATNDELIGSANIEMRTADLLDGEEIKGIDSEALLLELDAIGDFHVEELRLSQSRTEVESSRDLQEVEARSLEDIHTALKFVSEGTTGSPPRPMETKCILDPQEAEARLSEDLHVQVSEGKLGDPSGHSDVLHLQIVEASPTEDIDMVSKGLSEGTNDCPPKLIDSENDSSIIMAATVYIEGSPERMEIKGISDMKEIEARSLADIDVALKHACEATADDLPKPKDKEDGYTEAEVIERSLEHCVLEAQTSEKSELAGAVSARETDQSDVPEEAEQSPHCSSSSSSAPGRRKKEKSHKSDSSSSSSDSD